MGLRTLWRRLTVRPPQGPGIVLAPAEQVVLRLLHGSGSASREDVVQLLDAFRAGLPPVDADETLAALLTARLIEARITPEEGGSGTLFVATSLGSKLKGRIPAEPRSVMEFYL